MKDQKGKGKMSKHRAKENNPHWIIIEPEVFTCSSCGGEYPNGCETMSEAQEKLEYGDIPNYCPNCGEYMKSK